ncbi:MAG: 4Fe-4S dicluster domain-containing protein [Planctomycetota bacterium]
MAGTTRRHLLLFAGGAVLGAGAGAGLRVLGVKGGAPDLVRPPGARLEDEFLATCIRCGQCVQACPFDTLFLTDLDAGVAGGTPTFEARTTPCYLCEGHEGAQCIPACPTGALLPLEDFREARMGTAEVDPALCWPYLGRPCRECARACPFPGLVIELDSQGRPAVNADCCVGCGLCEHVCPADEAAIVVVPWKGMGFGA